MDIWFSQDDFSRAYTDLRTQEEGEAALTDRGRPQGVKQSGGGGKTHKYVKKKTAS